MTTKNNDAYFNWRKDFESDYDKKPSYLQVWQAAQQQSASEIAELKANNEWLRKALEEIKF